MPTLYTKRPDFTPVFTANYRIYFDLRTHCAYLHFKEDSVHKGLFRSAFALQIH
jgi:hypothetical protein